ncbi:MAG: sensor histidine kinase [Planctomycetota bacterium]|jgi:signal transduction histidine kinase
MPLRSKLIIYTVVMLLLFVGLSAGAYMGLTSASREAEEAREELAKLSLVEALEERCSALGPAPDEEGCEAARRALDELVKKEWREEPRALIDRLLEISEGYQARGELDVPRLHETVAELKALTIRQVTRDLESAEGPTQARAMRLLVAAGLAAVGGAATFAWLYYRLVRERRRLEERVRRSEKLAALGTLAAGIAHEINNPLAMISMSAEALSNRIPADSQEVGFCQAIQEEAQRCQGIIGDLSDLARGGSLDREPVDPGEVSSGALRIVRRNRALPDVVVEADVPENLPLVSADRGKLLQVLVNLLQNGIEASGAGGRVRLVARQDDGYISFRVRDEGRGIPPHLVDRIFDPFYSDKDRGVGLGLTLCHRIAELHGGELRVESPGEGEGSTFTLLLPLEPRGDGA